MLIITFIIKFVLALLVVAIICTTIGMLIEYLERKKKKEQVSVITEILINKQFLTEEESVKIKNLFK